MKPQPQPTMLLGGPMHGKEVMVEFAQPNLHVPVMRRHSPIAHVNDPPAQFPPPSYDSFVYKRERLVVQCPRPGWTIHEERPPDWGLAHPLLRMVWSEKFVYIGDEYRPLLDHATFVLEDTVAHSRLGEGFPELSHDYGPSDQWAAYRVQSGDPSADYMTEISCRFITKALDELDELIGLEH